MSEEVSEYTQLLREFAKAIGAEASEPDSRYGEFGPRRYTYKTDSRIRDEVMKRVGELLDRERRLRDLEESYKVADPTERDDFTWE